MMRKFFSVAGGILGAALAVAGCSAKNRPITVSVSQMRTYPSAARGSGCDMPVLNEMPKDHIEELAIVEGWAGSPEQEDALLQQLKDKGCEVGADALLLVSSKTQQASHKNTITMHNEISEASHSMSGSALDVMQSSYAAAAANSGAEGTPGHGGFYVETYAIKFVR